MPKFCSLNKDKIVQQIGKLPLSPDTCARRCDELSGDIFTQLIAKLRVCPAFSLALDESTDKSDTAQLMVSVRYFNEGVSQDFLCLIPLKGTTTARDVCSAQLKLREREREIERGGDRGGREIGEGER